MTACEVPRKASRPICLQNGTTQDKARCSSSWEAQGVWGRPPPLWPAKATGGARCTQGAALTARAQLLQAGRPVCCGKSSWSWGIKSLSTNLIQSLKSTQPSFGERLWIIFLELLVPTEVRDTATGCRDPEKGCTHHQLSSLSYLDLHLLKSEKVGTQHCILCWILYKP